MALSYYIAYNTDNNIRLESSSGGIFYSLAKRVLDNNGIVFGASWNKDWLVDMIAIDSLNDIKKLQRSKYVQANIRNTFNECKNYLEEGKEVLYSGTPCQIKNLKQFLKKNYSNLLTVEVCCHGLMPQSIWIDYLNSIKRDSPIVNIDMRDKSRGWKNFCYRIEYEDGKCILEMASENKYMKAYLSDAYLNKTCYSCNSKNKNSVADITIGDYWAAVKYYKEYNDNKGLSFIIANTKQGEKYVKAIEDEIDIKQVLEHEVYRYNSGLTDTIDSSKRKQYDKTIFNKKCAIISLPLHNNIGGYLQSYALQQVLKSLGWTADVIDYDLDWCSKKLDFIKNINIRNIKKPDNYSSILNNKYDAFIVGSDQIWRPKYSKELLNAGFLGFAKNTSAIKLSYAASFGSTEWEFNAAQTAKAKSLVNTFDAISVRELSGIDLCKNNLNINVDQTLDPTFLLDAQHYISLCKDIPKKENDIFAYFLDNEKQSLDFLTNNKKLKLMTYNKTNILDWLACFRDAKYIITDSFHGCVFSIIFNKPFICVENKNRGNARFETLKKLFKLETNFIKSLDNNFSLDRAIAPSTILLKTLKRESLNWLDKNLNKRDIKTIYNIEDLDNIVLDNETITSNEIVTNQLKTALVGIGKCENNYIREWVIHYLDIGFDKIFLLDNNDKDGERFEYVIGDFINDKKVELIDVRGETNAQIRNYDNIYSSTKLKDFDWVAFFDIDEFLYIDKNIKVNDFLNDHKFDNYNCIAINWKYYDDNNLVSIKNGNYNVQDRFTHEYKQSTAQKYAECKFTKRFVRCNLKNIIINSSHGPIDRASQNESVYCETLTNDFVKACNVEGKPLSFNGTAIYEWSYNGAHLKHYRFKTIEEYVNNKMKRGYPTLYKNCGKDLNLNDFFRLNTITQEKLDWLDNHNIEYNKDKILKSNISQKQQLNKNVQNWVKPINKSANKTVEIKHENAPDTCVGSPYLNI